MKKYLFIMIFVFLFNINFVYANDIVKYANCVDGDTFKVMLNDKEVVVRLLAVDTPESVKPSTLPEYYGKEASEFTCKKIENAKKIELEYDPNSSKYDKYDRLLAWVFVDGELLQTELVRLGYAKVAYLYNNYKYTDILLEKQELASAKEIGVWNNKDKEIYEDDLSTNMSNVYDEYTNKEIVIILILFLIIVFISDKAIKGKAKKKLKKYL